MNRRIVFRNTVIGGLIFYALFQFFTVNFLQVTTDGGDTELQYREQRFNTLFRLLKKLDYSVTNVQEYPPAGALLVVSAHFEQESLLWDEALEWVEAGNTLIYLMDDSPEENMLPGFPELRIETADSQIVWIPDPSLAEPPNTFSFPPNARTSEYPLFRLEEGAAIQPLLTSGNRHLGCALPYGDGEVILSSGSLFAQDSLMREPETGVFFNAILTTYEIPRLHRMQGRIRQNASLRDTPFTELLARNFPFLAALFLLIALFMYRQSIRFGSPEQSRSESRRSLVPHIEAVGSYLLRSRSWDILMETERRYNLGLIARRYSLPPGDAEAALKRKHPKLAEELESLKKMEPTGKNYLALKKSYAELLRSEKTGR